MVLQRPVPAAEAQARQMEPQAPEEVQEMVQVVGRSVQEHLPPLHREKGEGGVVLQRPVPAAEAQERQVEPQAREEVQGMVQVVGRSVQEQGHLPLLHRG